MDDWIEIEGKNKDEAIEAIERACDALNTTRSYLFFEILDEGRTTKIRARKREDEEVKEVNGFVCFCSTCILLLLPSPQPGRSGNRFRYRSRD